MVIIEKTDYTMVIQKENSDLYEQDFTDIQRHYGNRVMVIFKDKSTLLAKEALFEPKMLMLYFSEKVPEEYTIGTEVELKIGMKWVM